VANGIISSSITLPSFWDGLAPDGERVLAGQYERRKRRK
jgi:hypothetical protein